MKRQSPWFSIFSIGLTLALLALLAITIRTSGLTLFSPGRLSAKSLPGREMEGYASHAEFEARCDLCHQPLETTMDKLCLRCHESVGKELASQSGLHARIPGVEKCVACHPDHRGVGFDPGQAALLDFDHTVTDFSLLTHQVNYDLAPIDCQTCHSLETSFATPAEKCSACHAGHNLDFMVRHSLDYGENCSDCHDGLDSLVPFDHDLSDFSLEGRHAEMACADCHGKDTSWTKTPETSSLLSMASFTETPRACSACHRVPEAHRGVFHTRCSECHNPERWTPARLEGRDFEHTSTTGFSLARHRVDYAGASLNCTSCHVNGKFDGFDLEVCASCHAGQMGGPPDDQKARFMDKHRDQFGGACMDCHDGVDRLSDFDHAQVFPLDGKHAEIACQDCHAGKGFRGTPNECVACHAEPEIHAGFFGLECQLCHTTQAWTPAALSQHDFPLDHGGQGEVACQTCHADNVYVNYTCYGCHEHTVENTEPEHLEEGITLEELAACVDCHPTGTEAEGNN